LSGRVAQRVERDIATVAVCDEEVPNVGSEVETGKNLPAQFLSRVSART
jgi:hypothetical protein